VGKQGLIGEAIVRLPLATGLLQMKQHLQPVLVTLEHYNSKNTRLKYFKIIKDRINLYLITIKKFKPHFGFAQCRLEKLFILNKKRFAYHRFSPSVRFARVIAMCK